MTLALARSKTDQEAAGQVRRGRHRHPDLPRGGAADVAGSRRHHRWPVFRAIDRQGRIATGLSHRAIALILKRRTAAANIDPTGYSAHSLRPAAPPERGTRIEERDIGRHTRHRSIPVLRGYIREGTVFVNNASARLGL